LSDPVLEEEIVSSKPSIPNLEIMVCQKTSNGQELLVWAERYWL
jgi:hypothetical protein